ncbi:hypothetical protein [Roseateles sp.]|uniref:hypothetical protein n=1 Tax=Roseateles sp. TaxID=1971397 RepID=UPI002F412A6F
MTTALKERQPNCPAPKPPPPPKPPKFDERTERAMKAGCDSPPFSPEVIETLRGLLAPHARRKP